MQHLITSYSSSPASVPPRLLPSGYPPLPLSRADAHQPRSEGIAFSVHSLNEQPNVILDLICSFLDVFVVSKYVFPVSRRFVAQLRLRSLVLDKKETVYVRDLRDLKELNQFRFLARHWNLRYLKIQFTIQRPFASFDFQKEQLKSLNLGQECPRLERAQLGFSTFTQKPNCNDAADRLISTLSSCRFLRSLEYIGPAVLSLGSLKQLERLGLHSDDSYQTSKSIPTIFRNLPQLRAIWFEFRLSSLDSLSVVQTFPALEEVEFIDGPSDPIVEELVKLPTLKTLIIQSYRLSFSPVWGEFRTLERLVLNVWEFRNSSHILPAIPSFKELVLTGRGHAAQPWPEILQFLSLNLQVDSLVVPILRCRSLYQLENLSPLIRLMENLTNIKKLFIPHHEFLYEFLYYLFVWFISSPLSILL